MINLGENPWILIFLSTIEILFIIVPSLISSWISRTTFKQELNQIGVKLSFSNLYNKLIKMAIGIIIGIGLVMLSMLVLFFSRDIIVTFLFSEEFVSEGMENAIITQPLNPSPLQFSIFVFIQFFIIGPCEESFFRGFIITKLKGKMSLTFSIIISSITFAIYHVPPFLVPISTIISFFGYYFIIGVILSLVFIYSNFSLISGSLAHSVFNFLILIL